MSTDEEDQHGVGHNGGPCLDDPDEPPWGPGPIGAYFYWKAAHRKAWAAPREVMLSRLAKAEALGLTYREYTLELLERGRHLQQADHETIAAIKAKRPKPVF